MCLWDLTQLASWYTRTSDSEWEIDIFNVWQAFTTGYTMLSEVESIVRGVDYYATN